MRPRIVSLATGVAVCLIGVGLARGALVLLLIPLRASRTP